MKKGVKIALWVLVALIVVPVIITLLIPDKPVGDAAEKAEAENTAVVENPDAWKDRDESVRARVLLESALKERYAPRIINFPGVLGDVVVHKAENQQYIISSYFDVQNEFGVMTRVRYIANMRQMSADRDDWDLVSFEVQN